MFCIDDVLAVHASNTVKEILIEGWGHAFQSLVHNARSLLRCLVLASSILMFLVSSKPFKQYKANIILPDFKT